MRRKLTALVLCFALGLSLAVPALAADGTAAATGCEVAAFGSPVSFAAFTANETVYLRLRDVAKVLSGTAVQFNVDWSGGGVVITTGAPYTSTIGSEMSAPFSGDQEYEFNPNPVTVNGTRVDMDAIFLTDAENNGYTYCSPEALSRLLGFAISFDSKTGGLSWVSQAPDKNEPIEQAEPEETKEPEQPGETPAEQAEEEPVQEAEEETPVDESTEEVPTGTEEYTDGVDPIIWTGE